MRLLQHCMIASSLFNVDPLAQTSPMSIMLSVILFTAVLAPSSIVSVPSFRVPQSLKLSKEQHLQVEDFMGPMVTILEVYQFDGKTPVRTHTSDYTSSLSINIQTIGSLSS